MADFTTGHAHGLHFAHGEGREVVVQHEALAFVAVQGVDLLFVGGAAQRGDGDGLGFAAGEDHGAVGAGQNRGLDFDGTHGLGVAVVDAGAFVDDSLTHELLFQVFEHFADGGLSHGILGIAFVGRHEGLHLVLDGLAGILSEQLVGSAQGVFHAGLDGELFHVGEKFGIVLLGREVGLGLAGQLHEFFLSVDEGLDGLVGPVQAVDEILFLDELGFAFHHDHGVAGGGEYDVHVGALEFFGGGVQHELTVHAAEARTGHGTGEGNAGNAGGGGSCGDAEHVGIVFAVGGNDGGEHLHLIAVALGEERTDGAVDEAGHEGFMIARAAYFAAEEVAGNAAGGVHAFGIFHGEGEEVLGRFELGFADGDEGHGAAALNPDGAVGLTGHAARFQNDFLAAHGGGHTSAVEQTHMVTPGRRLREERRNFRLCSRMLLPRVEVEGNSPFHAGWGSGMTSAPPCFRIVFRLLAQTELFDQGAIALNVGLLEVVQHLATLADQLEQAGTGVEVLLVGLEMIGEAVDAGGKKGDLNFSGAGVAFVLGELGDNGLLLSGIHSHSGILLSDVLSEVSG